MRDGAGTYNLPPGNPVVTETVISSTTHNTTMADVATALTQSISKDGQTTYTGNQSMGGFKHTQVADATARNQYATAAQVQDGNLTTIGSVLGTDTITGTVSPAISAYAAGVPLTLIPVANNTGAVTLALNGLGAKPLLKFNSVPLVPGDLLVGIPAIVVYNGTSFYLENPQVVATDVARLSQANNFTSNNTFSVAGSATAPSVKVSSALPVAEMNNTAAPVDMRSWLNFVNISGSWVLRADNDAHSSSIDVIAAGRPTASTVNLALTATQITLNGVNVSEYPRLTQANAFTGQNDFNNLRVGGQLNFSAGNFGYMELVNRSAGALGCRIYLGASGGAPIVEFTSAGNLVLPGTMSASSLSGTLPDARVAQSNVTQHQAALAINSSQVAATPGDINSSVAVNSTLTGRILTVTNSSTITLTVTPNCLGADGKAALFIRRGSGAVDFLASGVTIRSPGGGTSIAVLQGKVALIQFSATEFDLAGNV